MHRWRFLLGDGAGRESGRGSAAAAPAAAQEMGSSGGCATLPCDAPRRCGRSLSASRRAPPQGVAGARARPRASRGRVSPRPAPLRSSTAGWQPSGRRQQGGDTPPPPPAHMAERTAELDAAVGGSSFPLRGPALRGHLRAVGLGCSGGGTALASRAASAAARPAKAALGRSCPPKPSDTLGGEGVRS